MKSPEIQNALGQSYDAIIIGSGAGGGTVAHRLAYGGKRVLVVERGTSLKEAIGDDPTASHFMYDILKGKPDDTRFIGGLTKFYGAAHYRMRTSDFEEVQHEEGISPAWPISYAEIEPYYTQAEALYRVHGSATDDPTDPPRSSAMAYPPIPYPPLMTKMAARLTQAGHPVSVIPRGLDYGPEGKCVLCTTCDAYYCPYDAKMDAEIAALRPALATGNLTIATQTECLRVLTNEAGTKASGVVLRHEGKEYTLQAETIVVAAGIPESALLLRRSRMAAHPAGLGNNGGALGRYYSGHSVGMMFVLVSPAMLPAIHTKSFALNQYYNGAPDWPHPLGVIQTAGQVPFWQQASRLLRPLAYLIGKSSVMCFYMGEALPSRESGLVFNEDDTVRETIQPIHNLQSFGRLRQLAQRAFGAAGYRSIARAREPYLWHDVGTTVMGHDPATSVVDAQCQVHGIAGLYVADASVLPTAGAVNTALTIMALALRVGDTILQKKA